jgi:NitT/TauT family transport system substrate-binding protein
MTTRRRLLTALAGGGALLAAGGLVQACTAPASAPAAPSTTIPPVAASTHPTLQATATAVPAVGKVRFIATTSTDAASWVPLEKGYFVEQGLEIERIELQSGPDIISALGTGEADVGSGAPSVGLYNAVSRGVDIRIAGPKSEASPGHGAQAIVVRKDLYDSGEIRGAAGLKGRRLAMPSLAGVASENIINRYMQGAGLRARDIELTQMAFPDMQLALTNKSIDAAWALEPLLTRIVDSGDGIILVREDQIYPYHAASVLLYSQKFIDERPDLARRFMLGYLKGARFYNDALSGKAPQKFQEVVDILVKVTAVKDRAIYDRMVFSGIDPDGKVFVEGLKDDQEYYLSIGLQTERIDVDKLVDDSLARYAVEQLGGPYRPPN